MNRARRRKAADPTAVAKTLVFATNPEQIRALPSLPTESWPLRIVSAPSLAEADPQRAARDVWRAIERLRCRGRNIKDLIVCVDPPRPGSGLLTDADRLRIFHSILDSRIGPRGETGPGPRVHFWIYDRTEQTWSCLESGGALHSEPPPRPTNYRKAA